MNLLYSSQCLVWRPRMETGDGNEKLKAYVNYRSPTGEEEEVSESDTVAHLKFHPYGTAAEEELDDDARKEHQKEDGKGKEEHKMEKEKGGDESVYDSSDDDSDLDSA